MQRYTWLQRLIAQDIAVARLNTMQTLRKEFTSPPSSDGMAKTYNGSYSFTLWTNHPSGRAVTTVDPCAVRPTYAPIFAPEPAEKYGQSTRAVLKEQGYSDKECNKLISENVISEAWSSYYLPT